MAECRYYEMCARRAGSRDLPRSCDARHCWMFCPMPDVDALLALAEELEEDACWEVQTPGDTSGSWRLKDACDRIREACGVVGE